MPPDYSLSVGINVYPALTMLQGAEMDACCFHNWATGPGGVAPQNAKLIVSSQFQAAASAPSPRPEAGEVWDFFETLRQAAIASNNAGNGLRAGERLYMFFSGHGFSPSIDASSVLMANAGRDTPHNLSPKAWADRFYENGLFDEVLLFQDACREPAGDVDIPPPYLKKAPMPNAGARRRFYAMAAKSPLLALEKDDGTGQVRGIFSATLMNGLQGGARDLNGDVTTDALKLYLRNNMVKMLTAAEQARQDVAKLPEVLDPEFIKIVPSGAFASPPGALKFDVKITLQGESASILDHARQQVCSTPGGVAVWDVSLPTGFYELVRVGGSILFKVTGAVDANGVPEVIHVQ